MKAQTKLTISRNKWFPKNKVNLFTMFVSKLGIKYPSLIQPEYNQAECIKNFQRSLKLSPLASSCLIRINDACCDESLKEDWIKASFKYFLNIDVRFVDF